MHSRQCAGARRRIYTGGRLASLIGATDRLARNIARRVSPVLMKQAAVVQPFLKAAAVAVSDRKRDGSEALKRLKALTLRGTASRLPKAERNAVTDAVRRTATRILSSNDNLISGQGLRLHPY